MSSTANLDQDALNNLTPEERAAFDDPEYSEAELAAMKRLAGDAPDDDDADDDTDEVLDADGKPVDVPVPPAKPADTPAPAAADTPAPAAPAAEAAPEPVADKPLVYKAALPEDYDAKVAALGSSEADAWAKFETGDLDRPALQAELSRISAERSDLAAMKVKAEVSQEMTQQSAEVAWNNAINRLYANAAKESGIDYRKDNDRNAELDQFVKVLANSPANADKSMDWFLTEAHKRVLALNGKTPTPTPAPPPVKPAQNRTPPPAPKSLAHVPGGEGPGDIGGEFAHLDALGGEDLEAAIAKMTPAQREKFSRGG